MGALRLPIELGWTALGAVAPTGQISYWLAAWMTELLGPRAGMFAVAATALGAFP